MSNLGKIGRLPYAIRQQLNQRLADHLPATRILPWLNSLPETRKIMAEHYESVGINKQNLSHWQNGGFQEWLAQQDTLATLQGMTDQAEELQPLSLPPLTDKLAPWLVARYFKKIHQAIAAGDDAAELKLLHKFCADVVHLRRGDHSSQRLRLAQARLDTEVEQSEEEIIEYFWKWVSHPEIHQCILDHTMTPEQKQQEIRRIFGLAPLSAQGDQSSVVQRSQA